MYDTSNTSDGGITAAWTGSFSGTLANTTTVGTTVTKTYTVTQTGLNSGMGINLSATSTSGSWLITNPGVFPPNCTIDRSAFAIDDNYVVAGTNTDGAVIPVFRYMSEFGGQSCDPNYCDASDLPPDDLDSYYVWYSSSLPASVPNVGGNLPSGTVTINYARFMNTNASSGTYAWSSPHLLSTAPWATAGVDGTTGLPYLDMTQGPLVKRQRANIHVCHLAGRCLGRISMHRTARLEDWPDRIFQRNRISSLDHGRRP